MDLLPFGDGPISDGQMLEVGLGAEEKIRLHPGMEADGVDKQKVLAALGKLKDLAKGSSGTPTAEEAGELLKAIKIMTYSHGRVPPRTPSMKERFDAEDIMAVLVGVPPPNMPGA